MRASHRRKGTKSKLKIGAAVLATGALVFGNLFAMSMAANAADSPVTPVDTTTVISPTPGPTVPDPPKTDAPKTDTPVVTAKEAPAPSDPPATDPSLVSKPVVQSLVQTSNDKTVKKVFVCKYVGTPGVDERPQTGQNPVSVSVNAIQHNEWDGTVPGYFSDAHDRSYVLAYDTGQAKPDVSACPTPVGPPPAVKKQEVGVYIYPLLDASKAPSWENSGKQIFCQSKDGTDWFTTINCTLPSQVCGAGWGYQQDKVKNWESKGAFNWPTNIQYPVDNIGWPPIYASQHGLLSALTTVPDCAPPPPTDVCKNLAGDQATVPVGFTQDGVNCAPDHSNVCTAATVDASSWTTEDGAPTTGTDGADFSTPNATDKVNFFGRALNVPFSGITGGSYTVKNTGGAIAAYDMEVWQTGTSSFATVVYEPYVDHKTSPDGNPAGDGTFHTYVITPTSLVWNSKITSGEGSQAQPVTLTRMQELIPAATLIRAGLGQGRNNAGSLSTVSSFTDPSCGYTAFPKKVVVVTVPVIMPIYTESAKCEVPGTFTIPNGKQFDDTVKDGGVTYTEYASPQGHYSVAETVTTDGVHTVQFTFASSNDTAVIQKPVAGEYEIVVIDGRDYAQWTHTFTAAATCPTTTPTPTPTTPATTTTTHNGGANTGAFGSQPGASNAAVSNSGVSPWGFFGGLAAAITAAIALFLVFRPKRIQVRGGVETP